MKGALPVGQMQPLTAVHAAWRVSVGWGPALKLSFGTQPVTPASVLSADGPLVAFHAWLSSTLLASGSCCPPPAPRKCWGGEQGGPRTFSLVPAI